MQLVVKPIIGRELEELLLPPTRPYLFILKKATSLFFHHLSMNPLQQAFMFGGFS